MRNSLKLFTLTAGLAAIGCGSSDEFNFNSFVNNQVTVTAPVAVADAFNVLGNGVLTGSVTANDQVNGATVSQFQNPSNSGGSVSVSSSGALTYTPPANQSNLVDTFTYTLSNTADSSTATVTVTIGARGFFVKNDGPNGTGTQTNPFNTLANAVTAATGINGAAIVVFRGDGTTTGLNTAATLTGNQTLSGQDPANPPVLTGPITLTSNNALTSLNFQGTVPAVVNGTNAANGTISSLNVTTSGNKAVFLGNATGTWVVQNSRFANANLGALDATCSTGTLDWSVLNCTFTNCLVDVVGNLTAGGNAVQTLTVRNSTFTNGRGQSVGSVAASTGTNMTITLTDNTVNGGGTALRGLEITTQNTCNATVSCHNNTITGCTSHGVLIETQNNSTAAARLSNNQLVGNGPPFSLTAGSTGSSILRLALDGNVANTYNVGGGGGADLTTMENLATLTTRNQGAFTTGALVDGPCPAP